MVVTARCPQCGGEIEFLDEVNAIKCQYCGSLLQLVGANGVRRYYLPPSATEARLKLALSKGFFKKNAATPRFEYSRLVFYPYWWVKGMVFKWIFGKRTVPSLSEEMPDTWENVKELKSRLLDHTFPALKEMGLGPSTLGVRTGALRVRIFNNEEMGKWGRPLPTTVSYDEARAYADSLKGALLNLEDVTVEMERTKLIGDRYAVVYFPLWIFSLTVKGERAEILLDGLSHRVISPPEHGTSPLLSKNNEGLLPAEPEPATFIPFRCPECGWDFPYRPLDVIHLCTTCGRAWREVHGAFREVDYRVIEAPGRRSAVHIYLPFWVLQVSLTSAAETLSTMGEFYQYFPVTRLGVRKTEPEQPIRFFVPAFRIKDIPAANKFSTRFTQSQPESSYIEKEALRGHRRAGIFLSVAEARLMAEILFCSLVPVNSRKAKTFLQHATVTYADERLEWYPFEEHEIYLREQTTGHALQANALDLD